MDYEPLPSSSFGAQAKARGVSARELMYDHLAGGDGSTLLLPNSQLPQGFSGSRA